MYLWSSSVCTEPVSGCTSYEGINQATVSGAITLKASCGCDVIVTGGECTLCEEDWVVSGSLLICVQARKPVMQMASIPTGMGTKWISRKMLG